MIGDHPLIRSRPFDPDAQDTSAFDCGVPSLDSWLRRHAAVARAMRTAATYVWVSDGRVVGYYAVSSHALVRDEAPRNLARNAPETIPAYLIGKLAVDRTIQGGGTGGALLLDAQARLVAASDRVAARAIVVDAINDRARDFYLAHGFHDVRSNPMTLWLKMSNTEANVAAAIAARTEGT